MDTKPRALGIEGLGDLSMGTHFCLFYETEQDLFETLALYFNTGLAKDEFCLWITSDSFEMARNMLRQAIPSADEHVEAGDIEILSCQQWFYKNDEFDAARALQGFDTKLTQVLEKGYRRMRVMADDAWLDQELWKAFLDFERNIDERFVDKPISIVCAYPSASHNAADILDIARTHRFIAAKRNGTWEILESPELKHVRVEAERFTVERNELEDKIQERTAYLSRAIQALQAEIIERRQAQEALTESQVRLQVALQAAQIGTGEWDLQADQVSLSKGLCRIYGFAPGTLTTSFAEFAERVHPEDRERFRSKLTEALASETNFGLDYRVVWPDGSVRWVAGRAHIHRDELSKPTRMVGASMDITERKRAEEALRVSEARLQAAINAADIVLWERDLSSGHITWLGHHEKLLGFAPGDLDDNTLAGFEKRVHPEDIEGLRKIRQRALEERSEYSHEYRVVWRDGSIHWIRAQGRFIYNEADQPIRLYGAVLDITERKSAENALRESEKLLQLVIDTLPVGVVVTNQGGDIILVNTASKRIWGNLIISGSERRARSVGFWHDSGKKIAPEEWASAQALSKGKTSLNELIDIETFDGVHKIMQNSAVPIRNFDGVIVGAVIVNEDVTERVRAQEAIRKSERVLREAEELGHTGSWEQDLVTGETFNSEANLRLFFGDNHSKGAFFEDFVQAMHPDDRVYVMQRRAQLIAEGQPGDTEFRVVLPDGSIHVIHRRATVVFNESGKAIRLYGTNVDITERKRAEEEIKRQAARAETLARIAARLNKQLDLEAVIHAVCQEAVDTFKVSQATMNLYDPKRDLLDYAGGVNIPPEYAAKFEPISRAQFDEFVRTIGPILVVPDIQALPNVPNAEFSAQFDVRTVVTVDLRRDQELIGVLVLGVNGQVREFDQDELALLKAISDQAAQAIANAQLFQTVSEHAIRMEAQAEISLTFEEAGLDYQAVLDAVVRRTAELIGDSCVMTRFSDDAQRSFPVAFHHHDPKVRAMMHEALMHTWQGGTDTQRYQALLAGHSIYLPVVDPEEFRASLEPEFYAFFDDIGISSVIIVPLRVQGRVIGTLGVTRDRHGSPYTPDNQVLLQDLADRAALTIQNARLFEQVESARSRLEALSRRLLEVQEAERRALTGELHDRVGQNLTGLSINLQNMKASLSQEEAQALSPKFDDAQALVEDTSRQIRDIMAELHLPELEDYGLAAALETYAERAASRGNLELITDLPDLDPPLLPSNAHATLFRAAQEAISNVLKHANATQLEVSLEGRNGRVRLKIEDNGQGFEPDVVSQKNVQTWGLQIMRERVESIGGIVQIESKPGEGTRVIFEIERPS